MGMLLPSTSESGSASGYQPYDRLRRHGHACAVLDSDTDREWLADRFVRDGLADGEQVWYVTDTSSPDAVVDGMHQRGLSVDEVVDGGRLHVVAAEATMLAGGHFDPAAGEAIFRDLATSAAADGFAGLRVTVELDWAARSVPGSDRLPELEMRLDSVCGEIPASVLCQYDRRVFRNRMRTFTGLHKWVIAPSMRYADPLVRIRTLGREIWLAGEADLSNSTAVARELVAVAAGDDGDVHLMLGELLFTDLPAARAIEQLARALAPPRRVVVHDPPWSLRHMIDLFRWSDIPGLTVDA